MSLCPCAPEALTSVAFADGTALVRCGLHERQQWQVGGRPAAREAALSGLRALFGEHRGRRTAVRRDAPVVAPVDALPTPVVPLRPAVVRLDAPDSERLTALLHARGLPGTWAVA